MTYRIEVRYLNESSIIWPEVATDRLDDIIQKIETKHLVKLQVTKNNHPNLY